MGRMSRPWGSLLLSVLAALALVSTGCTSSQDKGSPGFLVIQVAPSTAPAGPVRSATVTVVGIEARRADGAWVVVDPGPAPDPLVEGRYTALSIRLSKVDAT